MLIGILHEGLLDVEPTKIIVSRIIKEVYREQDVKFITNSAHGRIVSKIDSSIELFFNHSKQCVFAIFIGDTDKNKNNKKNITKKLNEIVRNKLVEIVLCCPNPHFEQWFITEENAVKNIFNLPGDSSLPYPEVLPKERLAKIIDERGNIVTTTQEWYCQIAEILNFEKLSGRSGDAEFRKFYSDVKNYYNRLKCHL